MRFWNKGVRNSIFAASPTWYTWKKTNIYLSGNASVVRLVYIFCKYRPCLYKSPYSACFHISMGEIFYTSIFLSMFSWICQPPNQETAEGNMLYTPTQEQAKRVQKVRGVVKGVDTQRDRRPLLCREKNDLLPRERFNQSSLRIVMFARGGDKWLSCWASISQLLYPIGYRRVSLLNGLRQRKQTECNYFRPDFSSPDYRTAWCYRYTRWWWWFNNNSVTLIIIMLIIMPIVYI